MPKIISILFLQSVLCTPDVKCEIAYIRRFLCLQIFRSGIEKFHLYLIVSMFPFNFFTGGVIQVLVYQICNVFPADYYMGGSGAAGI